MCICIFPKKCFFFLYIIFLKFKTPPHTKCFFSNLFFLCVFFFVRNMENLIRSFFLWQMKAYSHTHTLLFPPPLLTVKVTFNIGSYYFYCSTHNFNPTLYPPKKSSRVKRERRWEFWDLTFFCITPKNFPYSFFASVFLLRDFWLIFLSIEALFFLR